MLKVVQRTIQLKSDGSRVWLKRVTVPVVGMPT